LLVRSSDIPTAKQVLQRRGYRLSFGLSPHQEASYLDSVGQLAFFRQDDECLVELHTRIMPRGFHFPLTHESLTKRLEPISLAGTQVMSLGREDLLLVLCAHGAKHLWACLSLVCDVAELLRESSAMNWATVLERARVLRSRRMLLLGLFLARNLLQAPVPQQMWEHVQADPAIKSLALTVRRHLFDELPGPTGGGVGRPAPSACLFHLRARECLRDGLHYGLHLALRPTRADWSFLSLPPVLSPFYYLLRPARLAMKYGQKFRALSCRAPVSPGRE